MMMLMLMIMLKLRLMLRKAMTMTFKEMFQSSECMRTSDGDVPKRHELVQQKRQRVLHHGDAADKRILQRSDQRFCGHAELVLWWRSEGDGEVTCHCIVHALRYFIQ